jgi:hypothetical protein
MSTDRDQVKSIAERVAQRVTGGSGSVPISRTSPTPVTNGAPVSEELSAIRAGLHDLENKLDRIESALSHSPTQPVEPPRARMIDFLSPRSPLTASPSIGASLHTSSLPRENSETRGFVPATQSPWLSSMSNMYRQPSHRSEETNPESGIRNSQSPAHPSQERFGVEEAAVSELVEFFENEKKCSVDPSGKPCDHCAMCSGRGF